MWQSSGGHTSAGFCHAARLQVLQGTFLLFSGVIPLQQSPQEHPLWRMAVKFGARCTIEKHEDVTHVVTKSSLTEKVGCEHDIHSKKSATGLGRQTRLVLACWGCA